MALGNHPSLERILRCNWRLRSFRGYLLWVFFFLHNYAGLLCPFWRTAGRRKVLGWYLIDARIFGVASSQEIEEFGAWIAGG